MVTQYIYYNKDWQGQLMQETKHHIFHVTCSAFSSCRFFPSELHIREVYGTSKHQNKYIKKNSTVMSFSRNNCLVPQDDLPCCEQFHLGTIFVRYYRTEGNARLPMGK